MPALTYLAAPFAAFESDSTIAAATALQGLHLGEKSENNEVFEGSPSISEPWVIHLLQEPLPALHTLSFCDCISEEVLKIVSTLDCGITYLGSSRASMCRMTKRCVPAGTWALALSGGSWKCCAGTSHTRCQRCALHSFKPLHADELVTCSPAIPLHIIYTCAHQHSAPGGGLCAGGAPSHSPGGCEPKG